LPILMGSAFDVVSVSVETRRSGLEFHQHVSV
jgi:hypothetical protein